MDVLNTIGGNRHQCIGGSDMGLSVGNNLGLGNSISIHMEGIVNGHHLKSLLLPKDVWCLLMVCWHKVGCPLGIHKDLLDLLFMLRVILGINEYLFTPSLHLVWKLA